MRPSEYLRAGKAKIDAPEKWTQHAAARRSPDSGPVSYTDKLATCFCSGAALRSLPGTPGGTWGRAVDHLERQMGGNIIGFNDANDYATVIAAWDRAIAAAERNEAVTA